MEVDSAKKKRFRNEIENREFEIFRREKCKASRLVSAEFVGAIANWDSLYVAMSLATHFCD